MTGRVAAGRGRVLRLPHDEPREGGWLLGHGETLLDMTAGLDLFHLPSRLVHRKPTPAAAECAR